MTMKRSMAITAATFCSRSFDTEPSTRPTTRSVVASPIRPSVSSIAAPSGPSRRSNSSPRLNHDDSAALCVEKLANFLPQYRRVRAAGAAGRVRVASLSQLTELWRDIPEDEKVRRPRPPVKPKDIVYGVGDRPPAYVTFVAAVQHVLIATTVGLFIPTLVLDAAHASHEATLHMTSVCMLALGIGTILSCLNLRDLGSGYLMPASFSGVYFSVSILAARQGGLPLVAGMTMFAGLVQLMLSRLVRWLRPYLPTEIAGFAMLMSGFTLAVVGFNQITGVTDASEPMNGHMALPALLGIGCIAVMVGLHVWGSAGWRIYTVLIGLGGGYVAALALGFTPLAALRPSGAGPIAFPASDLGWPAFAANMMVPFAVAAIASSLRAIGDLTTVQKINDARWQRPDMPVIRGGLAANGLATMLSGLVGAPAIGTTSGSVGASAAAGVTSRIE